MNRGQRFNSLQFAVNSVDVVVKKVIGLDYIVLSEITVVAPPFVLKTEHEKTEHEKYDAKAKTKRGRARKTYTFEKARV